MNRLALPTAAVAAATLTGCGYFGDTYVEPACAATKIRAVPAQKIDMDALRSSAVVEARLTSKGAAVPGRTLRFDVLNDDAGVYTVEGTTGSDGVAKVNLKRANPKAWLAILRADEYRVSFAGDRAYCGSSDDAPFDL